MAFINRTYTFTDGTTAYGSQVDSEIQNIVTTLNNCDTAVTTWDNVKVTTLLPQANVAMGGHKITGLANGTAATDAVAYGQVSGIAGAITGSILMYPIKSPAPSGYLYCDGSAVSRGTYATLYGIIGNIWGQGDGSTTFNLPDYRGKFIRGVNDGTGNDPDASSRTAQATGGNTGDAAGSIQSYQYQSHNHGVTDPGHVHTIACYTNLAGGSFFFIATLSAGNNPTSQNPSTNPIASATTGLTVNNAGGNETRPINSSIYFFIKT